MPRARASVAVPGRISDAEALWYDLRRWPAFVDGFERLETVEGEWPRAGACVVWASTSGGRGRVTERVVTHSVRGGQTVEVSDPQVTGTQTVTFSDGRVALELRYELRERSVFALFFVRRAFTDSLRRTLERFARELRADLERRTPTGPNH